MPFRGLIEHGVGYMPGEVIIVGGRTGMGKTTFILKAVKPILLTDGI